MDWQLVLLSFLSSELEGVLFVVGLREGYGADLESESLREYLIFLVVPATSKSVPLALKAAMRWVMSCSKPSIFLRKFMWIYEYSVD